MSRLVYTSGGIYSGLVIDNGPRSVNTSGGTALVETVTDIYGSVVSLQVQSTVSLGTVVSQDVTGTVASQQVQTTNSSGSVIPQDGSAIAATYQVQTTVSSGSVVPQDVAGTVDGSQVQSTASAGTVIIPDIAGDVSSSQVQTTASVGTVTPQDVTGTVASSQVQSTVSDGLIVIPEDITGTVSSSQVQTTDVLGNVPAPPVTGGLPGLPPGGAPEPVKDRVVEDFLNNIIAYVSSKQVQQTEAKGRAPKPPKPPKIRGKVKSGQVEGSLAKVRTHDPVEAFVFERQIQKTQLKATLTFVSSVESSSGSQSSSTKGKADRWADAELEQLLMLVDAL